MPSSGPKSASEKLDGMTLHRLRKCVEEFTQLCERSCGSSELIVETGRGLLHDLIAHDDWLPEFSSVPGAKFYRQYLLHCDPLERFSIVSFVWGPGQRTPIHDHNVWGLVGVLRGAEHWRRFRKSADEGLCEDSFTTLSRGDIDSVSPAEGDIHQVANAYNDRSSISIHVYGANIGAIARNVYDPRTGKSKPFISGYDNYELPNLWKPEISAEDSVRFTSSMMASSSSWFF